MLRCVLIPLSNFSVETVNAFSSFDQWDVLFTRVYPMMCMMCWQDMDIIVVVMRQREA